jgi:hypothetical protein
MRRPSGMLQRRPFTLTSVGALTAHCAQYRSFICDETHRTTNHQYGRTLAVAALRAIRTVGG